MSQACLKNQHNAAYSSRTGLHQESAARQRVYLPGPGPAFRGSSFMAASYRYQNGFFKYPGPQSICCDEHNTAGEQLWILLSY
jgi:hypothetical protein